MQYAVATEDPSHHTPDAPIHSCLWYNLQPQMILV